MLIIDHGDDKNGGDGNEHAILVPTVMVITITTRIITRIVILMLVIMVMLITIIQEE